MKLTDLDLTALYDLADECIAMYHQEMQYKPLDITRGL